MPGGGGTVVWMTSNVPTGLPERTTGMFRSAGSTLAPLATSQTRPARKAVPETSIEWSCCADGTVRSTGTITVEPPRVVSSVQRASHRLPTLPYSPRSTLESAPGTRGPPMLHCQAPTSCQELPLTARVAAPLPAVPVQPLRSLSRIAIVNPSPAAIAVTPDNPAGGVHSPWLFAPQQATVPFDRSATVWYSPAEIAVTPLRPAGTVHWPSSLRPQQITSPLLRRATLCWRPAEIAVTPDSPAGTLHWPRKLSPQQRTVPACCNAIECSRPAEIAVTTPRSTGTWHWP